MRTNARIFHRMVAGISICGTLLMAASIAAPAPAGFKYCSLKGKTDEEISRFMGGKTQQDQWLPDGPDTTFPDDLWLADPKSAALGFIRANVKPSALARKGQLLYTTQAPPSSGWLVYAWHSSMCYSYGTSLTAIRFGVGQPFIMQLSTNANGVVGRNPFTDRTGMSVKLVPLTKEEAGFLAATVHWLTKVRRDDGETFVHSSMSSTGDGSSTLTIHTEGEPFEITGTEWSGMSTQGRQGDAPYNDETSINLIHHLLTSVAPSRLGDRWPAGDPGTRDLRTTLAERLKPNETSDARDDISTNLLSILEKHRSDPWPPAALAEVVQCAGELGLVKTRAAITELASTIEPPTEREKRFLILEAQELRNPGPDPLAEIDPFSKPQDPVAKARQDELDELRKEFKYHLSAVIRAPLATTTGKLRAADDPKALLAMAGGVDSSSIWAMQQLQSHYPALYVDQVIAMFRDLELRPRRDLFLTLAAAHPAGARKLRATLSAQEQLDLLIPLAGFELRDEPELAKTRIPALLDLLEDKGGIRDLEERSESIRLLSAIPMAPAEHERFRSLLLQEMKEPQITEYGSSLLSDVYRAIMSLPDPGKYWTDLITAWKHTQSHLDRQALIDALVALTARGRENRSQAFVSIFRETFSGEKGYVNQMLMPALALDLRELAPEIQQLSTLRPEDIDGHRGATSPAGHHLYHDARRVLSLWKEKDPDTLAAMWTALAVHSIYEFTGDSTTSDLLRRRCLNALSQTTPERRDMLTSMIRKTAVARRIDVGWLDQGPQ